MPGEKSPGLLFGSRPSAAAPPSDRAQEGQLKRLSGFPVAALSLFTAARRVPLALETPPAYDDHHMSTATSRRRAPSRKEATHDRIVETAARAIRRTGYGGTGVAEIMKEAGLTHGGFYAHFASREGMLAEAADRAGADGMAVLARVAAAAPPKKALEAMLRAYLSKEHVEGVESGCAVAALGSEMPRQAPKVRRAATRRIKEMIDLVARQSPDWGQRGAHERALVTVATALGALVMARAVDDPKLSDAVRQAALNHLTPTG
jgi:TetR/AcrR family transcriptional regulator, transcriptional repressor for nem operon